MLAVLNEIDRALIKRSMTWSDVATALTPPEDWERFKAADVLAMIDDIPRRNTSMSEKRFIEELELNASFGDARLSPLQAKWLHQMHERVTHLRLLASPVQRGGE